MYSLAAACSHRRSDSPLCAHCRWETKCCHVKCIVQLQSELCASVAADDVFPLFFRNYALALETHAIVPTYVRATMWVWIASSQRETVSATSVNSDECGTTERQFADGPIREWIEYLKPDVVIWIYMKTENTDIFNSTLEAKSCATRSL